MPSGDDDNLSNHLPVGQKPDALARFAQRQHPIDDRAQPPLVDHAEQRREVVGRPAVGAEDLQLERPDVADILARVEAGGGAAGEQPPAPTSTGTVGLEPFSRSSGSPPSNQLMPPT